MATRLLEKGAIPALWVSLDKPDLVKDVIQSSKVRVSGACTRLDDQIVHSILYFKEDRSHVVGALERGDLVAPRVVAYPICDWAATLARTGEAKVSVFRASTPPGFGTSIQAEVKVSALVVDILVDSAAAFAGTLSVGLVPFTSDVA